MRNKIYYILNLRIHICFYRVEPYIKTFFYVTFIQKKVNIRYDLLVL